MGRQTPPHYLMAKKKEEPQTETVNTDTVPEPIEPTELELVEAEMREISPTLKDLKQNHPGQYKIVYRRYMWLVERRDQLKAGNP